MAVDALNLPWQIQVSLASGYAAYITAFTGIRFGHKAIDTTFATLAFGLLATAILALSGRFFEPLVSGAMAFVVTFVSGLCWRKWGRDGLAWVLRATNVSWGNDEPSSFLTLTNNTKHRVSQIAVLLDDGTWLRCDDTAQFVGAQHHPCLFGQNGDIALYLTHEDSADGTSKELKTARDNDYGDRITYVPANRIRLINIRCYITQR